MSSRIRWLESKSSPLKAVTVVGHGLNLHPERMLNLSEGLREKGSDVALFSFSGHEGTEKNLFSQVSREKWLNEIAVAFDEAAARAQLKGVPLLFLGYSLSALYAQDVLNSRSVHSRPLRQVLLAPSIALHPYSQAVRIFGVFGKEFWVPSLSYGSYHAHRNTPVAAYDALFDSIDAVHTSRLNKSNIPTLVLMDPKDELVSFKRTATFLKEYSLNHWELRPIQAKTESLPLTYHHLLVDQPAVGAATWLEMNRSIHAHLFDNL